MNASIEQIQCQDKIVILVKTAHVSAQSVEDVKQAIEQYQPTIVCVELDKKRAKNILEPQDWEKTDIISIIKNKQTLYLLSNLILSNYQRKIAEQLKLPLGAEMVTAINIANENNIPLRYIDRPIQLTFSRIWRLLTFKEKFSLLVELIASSFSDEKITTDQLEEMKNSDMIEQALSQIQGKYSTIKQVLIDERDQYMAAKINQIHRPVVLAVVGAAHANGIKENLDKKQNLKQLESIPKKKLPSKLIGWIIPVAIVALIIASFSIDTKVGLQQIKTWVLLNGTLSAIGTALVLAHPLTILTAFVVAPISSLSPLLAAGWFAGLVEALVKKPQVKDIQRVSEDFKSVRLMLKNRFIKILLVVIMANIFSSIATFLSSFQIIKNLIESL